MSPSERSVARLVDVAPKPPLSPIPALQLARTSSCAAAGGARPALAVDVVDHGCVQLLTTRRTTIPE
ncbi:hypothetical protein [Leifsonia aquatica]|uniref:hypothetical protein n=1 Tax=Leifsonia aquatica TaxID=144185 RepID=UPI003807BE12